LIKVLRFRFINFGYTKKGKDMGGIMRGFVYIHKSLCR
jgi:hypothetical protein